MRADLSGLTFSEFSLWVKNLVGFDRPFHRELYRQLMMTGEFAPSELPMCQAAAIGKPGVISTLENAAQRMQRPTVSAARATRDDQQVETTKVLTQLADGQEVEAVVIPMRAGARHTLCLSSQVGCRMGCSFCHTAKMGLVRSLTAAEIVGQILAARAHTGLAPRNIVFMGMGEPLDNIEAVAQAIEVMSDRSGLALAHKHITVSTVGRIDGLARWNELGLSRVNLAVSLTAADDDLRSELMPVNRMSNLAALKTALLNLHLAPERKILISYVLIPGVNDGADHATRLIAWLDGLNATVNLIPYNPIPSRSWRAPSVDETATFIARLESAGKSVRLRSTKGDAVMAACGQLGDPAKRVRPLRKTDQPALK